MTLKTYTEILKVSEQTLSFTKTQTAYNSYFDNFKLFLELSKMKTDKVRAGMLDDQVNTAFDELTFATIQRHYLYILENIPDVNRLEARTWYELTFKRFNNKIQSFTEMLLYEILKIKADSNLSFSHKLTLINLYKNFIMMDYIYLCKDLIQNTLS